MSAIAEPPAKSTPEPIQPLEQAFQQALSAQEGKTESAKPEAAKPEATQEATKPTAEKPKAGEEKTATEAKPEVKPEKTGRKKSALEAALAEQPAAEAKPEPDEVQQLLESKDPNWDKAKETIKRQGQELKEARERISKASEPPPELAQKIKTYEAELAKFREENTKLRDSIVALDVRFDPATQEKFQLRDSKVEKLSSDIKENGSDAKAFADAMALPLNKRGPAIDAVLEAITSPRARAIIERKLAEIELMDEQLDEQLSKPHQTFEQIKQQREVEARQREEQVQQFKTATFEKIAAKLQKESPLFRLAPADSEGADEFNADLKADMEHAIELAGDVSPEDATVAAFKARRFDTITKYMLKEAQAKDARISELEETLRKFEGSETGYRGGKKPAIQASHEVPLEKAFMDALNSQAPI